MADYFVFSRKVLIFLQKFEMSNLLLISSLFFKSSFERNKFPNSDPLNVPEEVLIFSINVLFTQLSHSFCFFPHGLWISISWKTEWASNAIYCLPT